MSFRSSATEGYLRHPETVWPVEQADTVRVWVGALIDVLDVFPDPFEPAWARIGEAQRLDAILTELRARQHGSVAGLRGAAGLGGKIQSASGALVVVEAARQDPTVVADSITAVSAAIEKNQRAAYQAVRAIGEDGLIGVLTPKHDEIVARVLELTEGWPVLLTRKTADDTGLSREWWEVVDLLKDWDCLHIIAESWRKVGFLGKAASRNYSADSFRFGVDRPANGTGYRYGGPMWTVQDLRTRQPGIFGYTTVNDGQPVVTHITMEQYAGIHDPNVVRAARDADRVEYHEHERELEHFLRTHRR